jgi:hypothetical protein
MPTYSEVRSMAKYSESTKEVLRELFARAEAARKDVEEAERKIAEAEARVIDTEAWPKRLCLDVSVSKHSDQSVDFGREVCGFEAGSEEENMLRYSFGSLYAYFDVDKKGNAVLLGVSDDSEDIKVGDTNEKSAAERQGLSG